MADAIVSDFLHEAALTRRVLEAVPDHQWDWKPHDKSMSLRQLAGHLANLLGWIHGMTIDELDFAVAEKDFKLEGKEDDFLLAPWTMRRGEKVFMTMPRHEAIRSWLIHHPVHHRGQLTVYLRLLDLPVPATYGPTADDATMFE